MRRDIPAPVLAVVADFVAENETHATLDSLFTFADAPGEPPLGNKQAKALTWLRTANKSQACDPLAVLGKVIENYMEKEIDPTSEWQKPTIVFREKVTRALASAGLSYQPGGNVCPLVGSPTKALADFIKERNYQAINAEFDRAIANAEKNPREAVSAASNILESLCRIYIEEQGLEAPAKLDLQGVWNPVRKDLGFDPSLVEDQDLRQILTGLISVVHGVGGLRTHSSSAHGAGSRPYKLEPRHARLTIHSAHTVALFIMESWERRRK